MIEQVLQALSELKAVEMAKESKARLIRIISVKGKCVLSAQFIDGTTFKIERE